MNLMEPESTTTKKAVWNRIWYPSGEDVIGFRVFQMISILVSMVLTLVLAIFVKSRVWTLLMFAWLFISIILWAIASIRFRIINPAKRQTGS